MRLRRLAVSLCAVAAIFGSAGAQSDSPPRHWPPERVEALLAVAAEISGTGLESGDFPFRELGAALHRGEVANIDGLANALVTELARGLADGVVAPVDRLNWRINDDGISDAAIDMAISDIISGRNPSAVLREFEPPHAEYRALKTALKTVKAENKRRLIAVNLERWRWMPRDLGADYIIVNTPAFELTLIRNRLPISKHRVIVGARKTPTKQFSVEITGVALNPTWYVPPSIVAESVGDLMAKRPEAAQQLGYYVGEDGGVRQRPGPANALGQLKFVMPNPYGVLLHDTPNKAAFQRKDRALSHGCVRVDDAMGLAGEILGRDWGREMIRARVDTNETSSIDLAEPIPVYITYFTATTDAAGEIVAYRDIYGLDKSIFENTATIGGDARSEINCLAG